ncbi:hypothetical protein [Mesorhizobium sp.]|uniref:hypothetical protein n=1 Tax=Mesorhizobium sp. TaxID=1871066 RepID=UPI000FE4FF42|nr:hypothetical protein [Mesorhizobium sp.]RWB56593.1 MAG: hypothetical protein EOQ47_12010 [Mesorhizobium sp.]
MRGSNGVPALQALWRALAAVLSDSPLKPLVAKSIEPHVTSLREKARAVSRKWDRFRDKDMLEIKNLKQVA